MDWPRLQDLTKTLADCDIVINSTKFSIGRGLHNSLVIPHISVSRTHCIFEKIEGGKWCLFDKSSNGTVINGFLLNKGAVHVLNNLDTIELGETAKFTYKAPGQGTNTQLVDLTEQDVMNIADAIIAQVERGDDRCVEIKTTDAASNPKPEKKLAQEASSSHMSEEKKKHEETSDPEPKKKFKFGDMEDDLTCSICSEMFIKPVTLQCSHTFCSYCIDEWEKRRRRQCPICRAMLKGRVPTLILNNVIDKVLETAGDDVIKRRNEEIERRYKLEKQAPSSHKPGHGSARHRTVSGRSVRRTSGSREPSSQSTSSTLVVSIENETLSVSTPAAPPPLALMDELLERFSSASSWDEDDDDDNLSEDSFTSLEFEESSSYPNYNGLPGAYFGGYGQCHLCGDPNHWAGGCPNRAPRPTRRGHH